MGRRRDYWFEGRYYVLPREEENIYDLGATLGEAIAWLFESGVLVQFEDEGEIPVWSLTTPANILMTKTDIEAAETAKERFQAASTI